MRSCLILGAGRSGTSMLAGCLSTAGYFMGDNLMPANAQNPKGYFESFDIEAINEELLEQVCPLRPKGWIGRVLFPQRLRRPERWLATLQKPAEFRVGPDLTERISAQTAKAPFCFKDPRFCYTLPAWAPFIQGALNLVVFREPGRTATSILHAIAAEAYLRDVRMTGRRALEIWTAQYRQVLAHARQGGDWLFVHFDQILDGSAMPRIGAALGVHLDGAFPERRFKRSMDQIAPPSDTKRTYADLCELAGHRLSDAP